MRGRGRRRERVEENGEREEWPNVWVGLKLSLL
jgi:hypothetical protein